MGEQKRNHYLGGPVSGFCVTVDDLFRIPQIVVPFLLPTILVVILKFSDHFLLKFELQNVLVLTFKLENIQFGLKNTEILIFSVTKMNRK